MILAKETLCFLLSRSKNIDFPKFVKYLEELASVKKMDVNDLKARLVDCGLPGTSGATVSLRQKAPSAQLRVDTPPQTPFLVVFFGPSRRW